MKTLISGIGVFVVLNLGILSGCQDSGTDPTGSIDTKMFFSFLEGINPSGRSISLTFTTEQIYGMGGYRIIGRIERTGSQFTIHLDGIQAPEAGIAIPLPASATFQLGTLTNGSYSFNIVTHDRTTHALLSVTDTSLTTEIQANNYLVASRPRLLRVPPTIIWGQAESFTTFVYQNFLDSLQALGASTPVLPSGEYYYFTISPDGSFSIPSALGMAYGRHFLYRFGGDTSVTRNLVKRFAKRYSASVYVGLFGGRGEMYYTTVLGSEP